MFDNLTERLGLAFKKLRGHGKLTEKNIEEGLKEVRMALLEADVHYRVVKQFISDIKERAIGSEVLESLTPAQHIIKIVNEELTKLMGSGHDGLSLSGPKPVPIMLAGLQGSGKTTTAGKLALFLSKQGKKPFLVPADVYRPAAIEQLTKVGSQLGFPVFASKPEMDPVDICKNAVTEARSQGCDVIILDTAGRLHVDEALMEELSKIKEAVMPNEILFVADAMTGQDAVNVAKSFNDRIGITGVVLTKLDGDARGGAALSINSVIEKPVKYIGLGEKMDAFEPFHPDRMASRILGMGDALTFIEKAQNLVDEKKAMEMEKKLRKNQFTLEDFREQLSQIRRMGGIADLLKLLPGMGSSKHMKKLDVDDRELVRIEAIISSMTPQERRQYTIINAGRRKRIAMGSGTTVQDVNNLLKNYVQVMKLVKKFNKGGMRGMGMGRRMPF